MKKENIIIMVTFVLFFIEAMIHYNIGARSQDKSRGIRFPQSRELIQIVITVFAFSSLSGFISSELISIN